MKKHSARWQLAVYDLLILFAVDLLLLVAHPDDELLWFGGLLPTYAGERGVRVQVAYLVPATPLRRLEMLDALWQCGVKRYPLFAGMRDVRANTLEGQYKKWNRARLQGPCLVPTLAVGCRPLVT